MRISTLETIHTTLIRRRDQLGKIIAKEEEYLTKMIADLQDKNGMAEIDPEDKERPYDGYDSKGNKKNPADVLDKFIGMGGDKDFGMVIGTFREDKELCDKYDTYTKLREEEVAIRQALEDFERQNW